MLVAVVSLGPLLVALLAGCASTPPQAGLPLSASPGAYAAAPGTAPAGALPPAAWWPQFGDPLLSQLAAQAAVANTSVTSAQASLRQALALVDSSRAALGPSLNANASAGRNRSNGASANSVGLGLDAGFNPLADRSGLRASQASAWASQARLGDVQVAIATTLGLAYVDLRSSQARLAIADASLASQQQTLQIALWRQQAGLATQLDAEQARAAAAQTAAQLPLLRKRIDQGSHALAVLTGQPPAALQALLRSPAPLPVPPQDLALSLPADTLRQRADVQAAGLAWQAAAARVDEAAAARRPQLQLGGSLGLNALNLSGLGASRALAASLLASVAWPVFDSGANAAAVAERRAALDIAGATWQATVLGALQAVEDALVALRDDRARATPLQQAASAAATAAQLAQQRWRSGLADFSTVLETQRNSLATQDAVAQVMADISADHLRLFQALGGGWQPDTNPLTDEPATR